MSIRWITPHLGTGPALQVRQEADMNIIDVRDLVDKAGNRSDAVRQKISEGCDSLSGLAKNRGVLRLWHFAQQCGGRGDTCHVRIHPV